MGIEFELKFRANREALEAMDRDIPGDRQVYAMATTYYDTPTGALSDLRYTLRCRQENDRFVCTLKTPAAGMGRNEFELDCPDIRAALPQLCQMSGLKDLPGILEAGVVPVCYARFTRIAKTVVLPGCTVEVALDQGVLGGGDRQAPLCEAEVELKEGTEAAAKAYAAQLAVAYGLTPEPKSKFRRAQLLAAGEK